MVSFDFADFVQRWKRCRLSALKSVHEEDNTNINVPTNIQAPEIRQNTEIDLIRAVSEERWDWALKRVFDNSRKLAISASKHYGVSLEKSDFKKLLMNADIPCTRGRWNDRPQAVVVTINQCQFAQSKERRFCDWYKEAIDGVVIGLGENERYVRHGSQAYGDSECIDVIYDEMQEDQDLSYAPIPLPFQGTLDDIIARVYKTGIELSFIGYRAGTLFYTLINAASNKPLCQSKGRRAHGLVQYAVNEFFPTLNVQDASPLAVYGEGTK